MELEKLISIPIEVSLHELLAKAKFPKAPKFDNVTRMPASDPREITVVDEEWSEHRNKLKKGHQVWKF
jgi:N12 class adenine-specific DNA methylase